MIPYNDISLDDIGAEFGIASPVHLLSLRGIHPDVPTSGNQISMYDFRGLSNYIWQQNYVANPASNSGIFGWQRVESDPYRVQSVESGFVKVSTTKLSHNQSVSVQTYVPTSLMPQGSNLQVYVELDNTLINDAWVHVAWAHGGPSPPIGKVGYDGGQLSAMQPVDSWEYTYPYSPVAFYLKGIQFNKYINPAYFQTYGYPPYMELRIGMNIKTSKTIGSTQSFRFKNAWMRLV